MALLGGLLADGTDVESGGPVEVQVSAMLLIFTLT